VGVYIRLRKTIVLSLGLNLYQCCWGYTIYYLIANNITGDFVM